MPISRAPSAPTGPSASRSEEHTSELQSRTLISYAVFCLTQSTFELVDTSLHVKDRVLDHVQALRERRQLLGERRQLLSERPPIDLGTRFFALIRGPPRARQAFTLLPYTTLFR